MKSPTRRRPFTRILATFIAWTFIFGQTLQPALAATTPLADVPIAAKVAAQPNIIYTLDDSGSMVSTYIPEYVVNPSPAISIPTLKGSGTIATATVASTAALSTGDWLTVEGAVQPEYNGYFQITVQNPTTFTYTFPGSGTATATGTKTYRIGTSYCRSGNNTTPCLSVVQNSNTWTWPPFYSSDFNNMMYNPMVTYQPPVKADGTPLTHATLTDAKGNEGWTAAKYTTVQRDPYGKLVTIATADNLATLVTVPLYCTTDWPVTAGVNLVIGTDVGDNNGEYKSGTGAYCRINGTKYDASGASGASAVQADYNYPWLVTTGNTGPDNFGFKTYAGANNKVLWCDKTSPYWPQVATITSCIGGTTTYNQTTQTCVGNSIQCNNTTPPLPPATGATTPGSRTMNPASCKQGLGALSDPADKYCAPNTGGSDGNSQGTGSTPECLPCTCTANYTPPGYHCSVNTGTSCASPCGTAGCSPSCPNINGTINNCGAGTPVYSYAPASGAACNAFMWDPVAKVSSTTTLLTDANGAGVVCRHNNQTYAVTGLPTAGGLVTYPRTLIGDVATANKSIANGGPGLYNQLGQFITGATSAGCPTIAAASIPRHYYTIASVQFCDNRITTDNVQWRGFGTGTCQDKNDLTKYKNVQFGKFTRYGLYAGNTFPSGRVFLAGSSPDASNSESINYANWYAYYATRLNAAKTTSAIAFSYLTAQGTDPIAYRVGFHTLGDEPTPMGGGNPVTFVQPALWDLAQRTLWYNALFGVPLPPTTNYKTPTISAMLRIGNYIENVTSTPDPKVNPLPGTLVDPFYKDSKNKQVSCVANYHILFTDGVTNQIALPTVSGDRDTTLPSWPWADIAEVPPDLVLPNLKVPGPWPAPFKQGAPLVANTLSDVAAYYWMRDLRGPSGGATSLTNDVPSSSGKNNGDLDPGKDVAFWQHVNFSALSFGTEGTLDASDQKATITAIANGTQSWPDLSVPNQPTHPHTGLPPGLTGLVAVDDLWHAAVISRGQFVSARSPIEVSYGLASILAGIQNQRKSRVGATFGGQVLDANNDVIFESTIEPGWGGDVQKVQVNTTNGSEVQTYWHATVEIAKQVQPTSFGDEPWMDETKRRIVTMAGSAGAPFRFASLTSGQLVSLSPDPNTQKAIIAYLRGGTTVTVGAVTKSIEGTSIGQFRKRPSAGLDASNNPLPAGLGDVSNAQPAFVPPVSRPFQDSTDPGYSAFKTAFGTRSYQLVAGANDGMVHVLDVGPMNPSAPGGGKEIWAYIPKALFRGVAGNIATEDVTAIQALTYQDGGVPIYRHHMYVDSSPRVADVDLSQGAGTKWRTIAVGGLGKGGGSYYALDVTDPAITTEAQASGKVLWEWSLPGEVKYTYGRPVIIKVRDSGYPTGRWVVIVTGGYNNVSGRGKIFFIDAASGNLLSTVTTAAGTPASPSGLAQIHAFVKATTNQIAEQVYGGDLMGNMWRVDVSAADSYKSAPAVLFAQLTDPENGEAQPVTTAPQIEIDYSNGINRYVFIGTGRLLDNQDLVASFVTKNPQTQTMYAMRDGTLSAPMTTTLPVTRSDLVSIDTASNGLNQIVGGAPNGWFHDLPNDPLAAIPDSERIVVDVAADVNIVAYIGTKVTDDLCLVNLPAKFWARGYTTGKSLIVSGGTPIAFLDFQSGAVGAQLLGLIQADGTQTLGSIVSFEDPKAGGATPVTLASEIQGQGNKLTWRLLAPEN